MKSEWTVLLLGGASGVGKTHLSRALSDRLGIPRLEVDDLRVGLQAVVSRKDLPSLFSFIDNPLQLENLDPLELSERLLSLSACMWPSIEAVVEKHVMQGERIIIEGDSILPILASKLCGNLCVRSVFMVGGKEFFRQNLARRKRHGGYDEAHSRYVDFAFAYSQLVASQAGECGLPVFDASTSSMRWLYDELGG